MTCTFHIHSLFFTNHFLFQLPTVAGGRSDVLYELCLVVCFFYYFVCLFGHAAKSASHGQREPFPLLAGGTR